MCLDSTFDCTCSHTNMIYVHVICHMSDIELLGSTIVCLNPLEKFCEFRIPNTCRCPYQGKTSYPSTSWALLIEYNLAMENHTITYVQ